MDRVYLVSCLLRRVSFVFFLLVIMVYFLKCILNVMGFFLYYIVLIFMINVD